MARNDLEPHYKEDGWKVVFRLVSVRTKYRGNRIGRWLGFFGTHPRSAWKQVKRMILYRVKHQGSRQWLIWTGVVIGAAIWMFWLLPTVWPGSIPLEENPKPEAHRMAAIALRLGVLAFIAVASIPLVIWRTMIAQRNAEIAKQGLITERFTRAVEQIGTVHEKRGTDGGVELVPNIEVRLGGLYALERIAKESEDFHWQIMEMLTAYIRNPQNGGEPVEMPEFESPEEKEEWFGAFKPPREDMQTALTIIGRRSKERRLLEERNNWRLDLARTNLQKTNMVHAHLEMVDFRSAHLEGANLSHTHLDGANLCFVHLVGATLEDAHLKGANLFLAYLDWADLWFAHLEEANLSEAHLENANLSDAYLEGAQLDDTKLDNADFTRAHLEGAFFHDSLVWGTDFLYATGLTQEQVDSMLEGDGGTRLPRDIERPGSDRWLDYISPARERAVRRELWRDGRPPPGKAEEGEG